MLPTETKTEIPLLEGVCYSLTTSPRRFRFRIGHRARFWVAETWSGLPDEFDFVKDDVRFRLKKDGKAQCTYVFTRSRSRGQPDVCRELYFYPVRVVSMESIPAADPAGGATLRAL